MTKNSDSPWVVNLPSKEEEIAILEEMYAEKQTQIGELMKHLLTMDGVMMKKSQYSIPINKDSDETKDIK